MNIVNVGYDSTNYYVLADDKPRLLVDVGFPGTLPKLKRQCQRMDIQLTDIPYLLVTHFHPDHTGLAQELVAAGCKLMIFDVQLAAVPLLKTQMKPEQHYVEIDTTTAIQLKLAESRDFLAEQGIKGEVISTPGHSDDSVTLILDNGEAFTGDLPYLIGWEGYDIVQASWAKIHSCGAKTIYPGHGTAFQLNAE
jgi:endoribonuclease LACTB2